MGEKKERGSSEASGLESESRKTPQGLQDEKTKAAYRRLAGLEQSENRRYNRSLRMLNPQHHRLKRSGNRKLSERSEPKI